MELTEEEENQLSEADLEDFNDREDEEVPEYSEEVTSEDFGVLELQLRNLILEMSLRKQSYRDD